MNSSLGGGGNGSFNGEGNGSRILVSATFLLVGQSALAGTMIIAGPVEMCMNVLLAWGIWAEPKLHSRGSKLLFLLSCADGCAGLLNVVSGLWMAGRLAGAVGQGFGACLRVDLGLRMGLSTASTVLMLSLAFDRFLARDFWMAVNNLHVRMAPSARMYIGNVTMLLTLLIMGFYVSAICASRRTLAEDRPDSVKRQIRRFNHSLTFIVSLFFFSFFISLLVVLYSNGLEAPEDRWNVTSVKVVSNAARQFLVKFNTMSNPLVFYFRNADYRRAMRCRLGLADDAGPSGAEPTKSFRTKDVQLVAVQANSAKVHPVKAQ